MRSILIAGQSEAGIRRGVRVAADLSVACGAPLALAWIPHCVKYSEPAHEGQMSDPLFRSSAGRSPVPSFAAQPARQPSWLAEVRSVVDNDWGEFGQDNWTAFIGRIEQRPPSLIVACEPALAGLLIDQTSAPVWHARQDQAGPNWLSLRRLRCHAQGLRATAWARNLAESLGAELELAPIRHHPDMAVLSRGRWRMLRTLAAVRSAQPLVMV